MPIAVIVDWYGPYHGIKEFKNEVTDREWEGSRILYMALGRHGEYRYIGMTISPKERFRRDLHRPMFKKKNKTFYAGAIETQHVHTRRGKKPPDLRFAEHALIYFLKPRLNTQNKFTPPADCVSVFSRFFDLDEEPKDPPPLFPPFVAYDSYSRRGYRL